MHKKLGDPVTNCALYLREVLKKKGKIVRGTCITEQDEKFDYYWVEDDSEEIHDISFYVAKLNDPSISELRYELKKGEISLNKDEQSEKVYALYMEKTKEFWGIVPRF
jgi:predicted HTH domain antitoxin